MSSPEKQIVSALMNRLGTICDQVLLGYSATGIEQDLDSPSLLVQLESMTEQEQQGARRKYLLQFNLSAVVTTDERTTYALLDLSRTVREALGTQDRLSPEVRKLTFSDTQFDIAPNHTQLSFADMTLTIETVF